MPRLHPLIGPLVLLSVVTSTALNRATLSRKEEESRTLHSSQVSFLSEQLNLLRRNIEDERDLTVKRCIALGIHPHDIGIHNVPTEVKRLTPERLSWNQVFFGSESVLDKLKTSVGNAAVGLKGQFSSSTSTPAPPSQAVEKESADQWETEFMSSIQKIEEQEKEQERQQQQLLEQEREQREREARLAYLQKYDQQQQPPPQQQQQQQTLPATKRRTMI
ncbi:unnamed protein product [Sympodiomycopsis kandeliae]